MNIAGTGQNILEGVNKMGKLWDWHKKMFNTPVIAVSYFNNGQGKKACKVNGLGSSFNYFEGIPNQMQEQEFIEFPEPKKIDISKMKRINYWPEEE